MENQIIDDMDQDIWIVQREIEMLEIEKRTFKDKRKELQEEIIKFKKEKASGKPIPSPRKTQQSVVVSSKASSTVSLRS